MQRATDLRAESQVRRAEPDGAPYDAPTDPRRAYTFGLHTILAGIEQLIAEKRKGSHAALDECRGSAHLADPWRSWSWDRAGGHDRCAPLRSAAPPHPEPPRCGQIPPSTTRLPWPCYALASASLQPTAVETYARCWCSVHRPLVTSAVSCQPARRGPERTGRYCRAVVSLAQACYIAECSTVVLERGGAESCGCGRAAP